MRKGSEVRRENGEWRDTIEPYSRPLVIVHYLLQLGPDTQMDSEERHRV